MGNLKNKIREEIIEPYMNNIFTTVKARVTSFDSYRNRANIEFQNPKGQGTIEREMVPIQIGIPGFYSSNVEEGDYVWVTFENGNPLRPKIIGVIDERYEINTREKIKHILQGGLLTNEYKEKEYIKKNRISSWVSENSIGYAMQIDYARFDIEGEYFNIASKLGYYKEKELGFTHVINGSTIKITNDGDINILVSPNQGIRINTSENKIYLNSLNEISLNSPSFKIDTDNLNVSTKKLTLNGEKIDYGLLNKQ